MTMHNSRREICHRRRQQQQQLKSLRSKLPDIEQRNKKNVRSNDANVGLTIYNVEAEWTIARCRCPIVRPLFGRIAKLSRSDNLVTSAAYWLIAGTCSYTYFTFLKTITQPQHTTSPSTCFEQRNRQSALSRLSINLMVADVTRSLGHDSSIRRDSPMVNYPRRARSAIGVDTVFTLDVCLYVCMYVSALERKRLIGMTWNSEP